MSERYVLMILTFLAVKVYSLDRMKMNTINLSFIGPTESFKKNFGSDGQNRLETTAKMSQEMKEIWTEMSRKGQIFKEDRLQGHKYLHIKSENRTFLPFGVEIIVILMGKAFVIALISVLLTAITGMKSIYGVFSYPNNQKIPSLPVYWRFPHNFDHSPFDFAPHPTPYVGHDETKHKDLYI